MKFSLPPETVLLGRFVLEELLSSSEFSIVYLAWDTLLLRKVVIKEYFPRGICSRKSGQILQIKKGSEPIFELGQNLFERENNGLNRNQELSQIIHVYKCFRENDTSYAVMEYVNAVSLEEILEEPESYPFYSEGSVITQLIDLIDMIHDHGICHFGLEPAHILLDEQGKIKLISFSWAKLKFQEAADGKIQLFHEAYTAPEVITGTGADSRADTYSVGSIYYRMLSEKTPLASRKRLAKEKELQLDGSSREEMINILADPDKNLRPSQMNKFIQRFLFSQMQCSSEDLIYEL